MATIPTPRSFNRIMGDMINGFLSRFGVKSLRVGSPILAILESAAQSDMRTSQDIFNLLNSDSLDRATGIALDRKGLDEDLPRLTESAASGTVSIFDTSFTKLSTKIYQAANAPVIGTTVLSVSDASAFPASGSIYLGRGTTNYEGPIAYTGKTNVGANWTLTLVGGTTKFHNLGETVVLAQGGVRNIQSGTLVQTPQGNTAEAVQFSVQYQASIPDGETQVDGVTVISKKTGVIGNVPAGAINNFVTPPFTGAIVKNNLPLTNGQSAEDDSSYRERIKNVRASRSVSGTNLGIKTAITGITAPDENKRVLSASVVTRKGLPTTVYIDDGTGYEQTTSGVAQETIVDSALGGEQFLQLAAKRPMSKAFVQTLDRAPYNIASGSKLSVKVGSILSSHTFLASDFRSAGNATAAEVVSSINANPILNYSARTALGGTAVVLFAKVESNEDIEVVASTSPDANSALAFPLGRNDTLKLYKNDRLLSKDGRSASLVSAQQSQWLTMTTGETLVLNVDGTGANTYTFTDADFVSAGVLGVTTLQSANPIDAWVAVINAKMPGVTATNTSGTITLTSNVGASARASLNITGGSLVTKGMFTATSSTGTASDYQFNRSTGQIILATPLAVGDSLTAGSTSTRAFIQSAPLGTVDADQDGGPTMWIVVDGAAQVIPHGITAQTLLTFSTPSTNRVRITASGPGSAAAFSNIQAGDWLVAYDLGFTTTTTVTGVLTAGTVTLTCASTTGMTPGMGLIVGSGFQSEVVYVVSVTDGTTAVVTTFAKTHGPADTVRLMGNQGSWRVEAVTATTVDMERSWSLAQSNISLVAQGLTFVRTTAQVQAITIPPALGYTRDTLVTALNNELVGALATPYLSNRIRIATDTYGINGDIALVAVSPGAQKLGFVGQTTATTNLTSHAASIETGSLEYGTPTFVSSTLSAVGVPNVSNIAAVAPASGIKSGMQLVGLRSKPLSISEARVSSNEGHNSALATHNTATGAVTLRNPAESPFIGITGGSDKVGRVALHNPLSIGPNDTLTVVADNDPLTKRFTFNAYRRVKPATGTYGQNNNFKDLDNGTGFLASAFGNSFPFYDYAMYMRARGKTHDSTAAGMLWRYYRWGPEGERVRIGYDYPTAPGAALTEITDSTTSTFANVRIMLGSGAVRSTPSIRPATGVGLAISAVSGTTGLYTYWYLFGYSVSTASRTTNVVTATLTLPQGGTDPGLKVGDSLFFNDTSALFGSAVVTIATVNTGTAQITFNLPGADVGATATPGSVSMDTADVTLTGTSVVVGDIVTIDSTATFTTSTATSLEATTSAAPWMGKTMRVNTLGAKFISCLSNTNTGLNTTPGVAGAAIWRFVGPSTTAIRFYPLANNSSLSIATATQALVGAPVVGTALSTGALVTKSTWEENGILSSQNFGWVNLSDGINYCGDVAVFGDTTTTDYQLQFKDSISAGLAGGLGCDWLNEEIRIAPLTWAGMTSYMMLPSISGLSSVANVQASSQGDKLQINSLTPGSTSAVQITSGTANAASATIQGTASAVAGQTLAQIAASDGNGFFGDMYVSLSNASGFTKTAGSTSVFTSINTAGVLNALASGGGTSQLWSYGGNLKDSLHGFIWQFERQGKFLAITNADMAIFHYPDLTGVTEGMMVAIDTPTTWQANITFAANSDVFMRPSVPNGHFYYAIGGAGTTGATEPIWPTTPGGTVVDNGIVWGEMGLDLPTVPASNQGLFRIVRVDNNSTTLTGLHPIGSTTFNVASTSGFYAGMHVTIEPNTPNSEIILIGTITSPTQFTTGFASVVAHADGSVMIGSNKTLWIENPNMVEGVSGCNITVFDYFLSALPGDALLNSQEALGNIGQWTVAFPSYKHNFPTNLTGYTPRNQYQIVLDTSVNTPTAFSATVPNIGLVVVQDATPARLIKQISTISPNPTDPTKLDVKFNTAEAAALISPALGTTMVALDKLAFPVDAATGVDSYSITTGLIGEATRVLYGDDQNPAQYPGVLASGAEVTVSGPLVKRLRVSLSVRVRTGVTAADVTDRVKNVVAGVINRSAVGQSIAISDIVTAAGSVNGVVAVSVISPAYNLSNDTITVQPFEKALVQNLDTDVLVSIVGS